MVKYLLPSPSSDASASYDGRYIIYLGKTLYVYDTTLRKKVATLPRLGNALSAVSRDNTMIGCVHPTGRVVEAVLIRMDSPPEEIFRIPFKGQYQAYAPCFTYDNKYMLFTIGYPKTMIYAIEVSTGTVFSMYETTETSVVANLFATAKGIIAVEHESPVEGCSAAKLLLFQTVFSPPVEMCFDKLTCENLRKELKSSFLTPGAVGLTQDKLLIYYDYASDSKETRFEVRALQLEPTLKPAPDIFIPYSLVLPPVATTDGEFVAFMSHRKMELGIYICVYQTADWSPVLVEHRKYVWDLHFIPNTHDLIVSGEDSCVITIEGT